MTENLILAVDTSCDDTSVAVVQGNRVLANIIASQTQLHKPYGGVFPTVAKLAHKENILPCIALALKRAQVSPQDLSAVAVTVGPGLAPALEVGIAAAEEFAQKNNLPLLPINHIEGHILSVLAISKNKPEETKTKKQNSFPVLSIVVSGGHTEFVLVHALGKYEILGQTLDDAAGECLDKIGRMLNLGYPAGPVIEEFAKKGNANKYPFPLPLTTIKTFDMSFSGMKTFARNFLEELQQVQPLTKEEIYDFCASAQYGVFRHICYKLSKVLEKHAVKQVWLGGGVAANKTLRRMIRETLRAHAKAEKIAPVRLLTPYTKKLCADNAAMVGVAAGYKTTVVRNDKKLERIPRLSLNDSIN